MTQAENSRQRFGEGLALLTDENKQADLSEKKNGSVFSDPAFAKNKLSPVHRWVPWIAGFSNNFVRDSLDKYLQPGGKVLDPFAGVGTTLVEAVARGHNAVGFELNPYAALACRMKANAHHLEVAVFDYKIKEFQQFYLERLQSGQAPKSIQPMGFRSRAAFYSPKVLHKVLTIWDFIHTIGEADIQNLFRLAFASTMVQYSNYSYEPSLGRRASAGRDDILDYPVGETISIKLKEMAEDIKDFKALLSGKDCYAEVICDSFFKYQQYVEPGSIDLVVTSPPYLNNYHYNRNTRPQLYWLGYAQNPNDMEPLEEGNFGKYWQTVREQDNIELSFTISASDLLDKLRILRGIHREKGVYGGNGWANYATSYFNDCLRFARGLDQVLTVGGTGLVVIGNSILQGVFIPTDRYFAQIAEHVGLKVVDIHVPRAARVGNSIIKSEVRVEKAADRQQLYEAVVELRKL